MTPLRYSDFYQLINAGNVFKGYGKQSRQNRKINDEVSYKTKKQDKSKKMMKFLMSIFYGFILHCGLLDGVPLSVHIP